MLHPRPKWIVVVGPTASGKSALAILLARLYHGEIISADSRQVYRGMDIGSGKITHREQRLAKHYLLDVASPKRTYNISHFLRDAKRVIAGIERHNKLPIVCGGTNFWVQALLENTPLPPVPPNRTLRLKLARLSAETLFRQLQRCDPKRAAHIDPANKVRLLRALEICQSLGQVPPLRHSKISDQKYVLIIALSPDPTRLRAHIRARLTLRLKRGLLAEVRRLRATGLSWQRLESFGLEYRYCAQYLQGKISRALMEEQLFFAIWHFARRQLSWLRRLERMGGSIIYCPTIAAGLRAAKTFLSNENQPTNQGKGLAR